MFLLLSCLQAYILYVYTSERADVKSAVVVAGRGVDGHKGDHPALVLDIDLIYEVSEVFIFHRPFAVAIKKAFFKFGLPRVACGTRNPMVSSAASIPGCGGNRKASHSKARCRSETLKSPKKKTRKRMFSSLLRCERRAIRCVNRGKNEEKVRTVLFDILEFVTLYSFCGNGIFPVCIDCSSVNESRPQSSASYRYAIFRS